MPVTSTRPERKTDRQDTVLRALRERIVRGDFAPGSRLPNRVEIEQSYAASSITVQRALERLKEEGFVVASRRSGTYVVHEPPHLTNFALVFPSRPNHPMWNRFWSSLCRVATGLTESGERKIRVYYGVDGHEDSEDFQNLVRAVQAHRLAGIVFGNSPADLRNTPLLEEPGIGRVAIMSGFMSGVPHVYTEHKSFVQRAFEHLAQSGCKRIGVLQTVNDNTPLEAAANRFGVDVRSYWMQRISLWSPSTARGVVHLMMHPGPQEKPDALVVADDNLLEPALEGLADAGVTVGPDFRVVTHCNFPWPVEIPDGVTRLGFDSRQVLAACLESLDRQQAGETVNEYHTVGALFEPEVAPV